MGETSSQAAPSPLCYAHSRPDQPQSDWETLAAHAGAVGDLAGGFAAAFGFEGAARAAGLLHDAGKASREFQAYLRGEGASVDHSTHGARIAKAVYHEPFGRMLALCIAGHHAGLADASSIDHRLGPANPIPNAAGWEAHITPPPWPSLKPSQRFRPPEGSTCRAFMDSFVIRMLFSCLVDADFLATEAFMSRATIDRGVNIGLQVLQANLSRYMHDLRNDAEPTELNALRAEVLDHAVAKAGEATGLFTLTVPTGGGKTLASLSFALAHGVAHRKRRVIYVIPYTSIIEQTADIFRSALGGDVVGDDVVLEHHSNFDWEQAAARVARADGGDERDGLGVLRRAAENWDAPVIVTTAVQFFESLFANRTSACRKLHNIADSVIVLDEAQTLPQPFLLPCLAALDELKRNYRVSVVFCTATQPALRRQDRALVAANGSALGLDIPDDRELAPRPRELYAILKRTQVEVKPDPLTDDTIAERFAATPQMLCIVNSRGHARTLFDRIAALPGAAHLTTLMCPAHRRQVLAGIRGRLKRGEPVRLVATSLIEAGVDISFPEVWRAMAGVDSIAQAAGRCNREGELLPELGSVVVFTPAEARPPRTFEVFQQAAQSVLRDHAEDPLSLDAVDAYFRQLWFQKGSEALDAARIGDLPGRGVLPALADTAQGWRFPFESIAKAFRLIDDVTQPVVVPWNAEAEAALRVAATADRLPRDTLRKLRQFTVNVPQAPYNAWLAAGAIVPVRPDLSDALVRFADRVLYRDDTGVDLVNPLWRGAEDNIW